MCKGMRRARYPLNISIIHSSWIHNFCFKQQGICCERCPSNKNKAGMLVPEGSLPAKKWQLAGPGSEQKVGCSSTACLYTEKNWKGVHKLKILFQKWTENFKKNKLKKNIYISCTLHFLSEMLANNNEQEVWEGREREQLQITPAVKTSAFVKQQLVEKRWEFKERSLLFKCYPVLLFQNFL